MLQAPSRAQKAVPFPIVAPVGGLNARDALAAMPPEDASVMLNLFPYADKVSTRPGRATVATQASITKVGTSEGWRRIMLYIGTDGTETAYGAFYYFEDVAGTGRSRVRISSIASNGTITTAREIVTLASTDGIAAVGEWTQFSSAAGLNYLFLMATTVNAGATIYTNAPQIYNGSSWAAASITGLPEYSLGVHAHRSRLWFYGGSNATTASKPLSVYYLPTGAIAGAVTEFNLGPFATKGGTVVAMRTWTMDNGEGGTDDMAVFVTDQGQVLIYQGTDPSSAATWRLVGVFDVGKLASYAGTYTSGAGVGLFVRDSFAMKYGNDVLILTQNGPTSLQRIYQGAKELNDYLISDKIRPLMAQAASTWAAAGATAAWHMVYAPLLQHLVVFVPSAVLVSTNTTWTFDAYVMNSSTGAWTKYDSLNALDSIVIGGAIWFISPAYTVQKIDGSATSEQITYECRQAYNYFQSPANKVVTLMQPMLFASGNFSLTAEADGDFNGGSISAYTSYTASSVNVQPMISANKHGRAIAAHIKGQVTSAIVSWYATNWIFRHAGLV